MVILCVYLLIYLESVLIRGFKSTRRLTMLHSNISSQVTKINHLEFNKHRVTVV